MTTTYTIVTTIDPDEPIRFQADLTQASAPIRTYGVDENADVTYSTPYQTADARHRPLEAAVLVLRDMGREYWLDPDDLDEDGELPDGQTEDEYIRSLIVSVEEGSITPRKRRREIGGE